MKLGLLLITSILLAIGTDLQAQQLVRFFDGKREGSTGLSFQLQTHPFASSVFTVARQGQIYIVDIDNRIVVCDTTGAFVKEIRNEKLDFGYVAYTQQVRLFGDQLFLFKQGEAQRDTILAFGASGGRITKEITVPLSGYTLDNGLIYIDEKFIYLYDDSFRLYLVDYHTGKVERDAATVGQLVDEVIRRGGDILSSKAMGNSTSLGIPDESSENRLIFIKDTDGLRGLTARLAYYYGYPKFSEYTLVNFAGEDGKRISYWLVRDSEYRRHILILSSLDSVNRDLTVSSQYQNIKVMYSGDIYALFINTIYKSLKLGIYLYKFTNDWRKVTEQPAPSGSVIPVANNVTSSAFLTEPADNSAYHPVKLFDGDPKTMWIENATGPGIGESVTVGFEAPITVDEIQVMPGAFWKEYWKQNYRVKSLEVKLDDKVFSASFKDEMTVQSLKLSAPVTFKTAVFTIKDVYPTTKWEDTAISEITFYNQGVKVEVDYSKFKEFLKKAP